MLNITIKVRLTSQFLQPCSGIEFLFKYLDLTECRKLHHTVFSCSLSLVSHIDIYIPNEYYYSVYYYHCTITVEYHFIST